MTRKWGAALLSLAVVPGAFGQAPKSGGKTIVLKAAIVDEAHALRRAALAARSQTFQHAITKGVNLDLLRARQYILTVTMRKSFN